MGKGDKKTKRGKIVNGSYGVLRRRKKLKAKFKKRAVAGVPKGIKVEVAGEKPKVKTVAVKKATVKKTTVKKTTTAVRTKEKETKIPVVKRTDVKKPATRKTTAKPKADKKEA